MNSIKFIEMRKKERKRGALAYILKDSTAVTIGTIIVKTILEYINWPIRYPQGESYSDLILIASVVFIINAFFRLCSWNYREGKYKELTGKNENYPSK